MKKLLSILTVFTLLISSVGMVFADANDGASDKAKQFSDVPSTHWAISYINFLSSEEIIAGYPDGSFKPQNNVKINEFITMAMKSLGYSFESKSSDWAKPYIDKAIELGVIEDREFDSYTANITREQMVSIAGNSIALTEPREGNQLDGYIKVEVKDYHTITGYYIQDVLESYKWGLVGGYPDGTFRPKNNATRAEACIVLNKMQKEDIRSPFTPDNAAHVIMPIGVWYDREGNIVDMDHVDLRYHTYKQEYVPMYAPIYNRQPVNELVDVAKLLIDVADNGKGYLKLGYDMHTQNFSAPAYQTKKYYDDIFQISSSLERSFLVAERKDFTIRVETQDLGSKYKPYDLTIWKSSRADGYSSYSKYFLEKYSDQIKPLFEYLFEDEYNTAWEMFIMALDYKGVSTWTEKTINGRNFNISYSADSMSIACSLKK